MGEEGSRKRSFVTKLSDNDVLVGRGVPSIENEGNVRFRGLVNQRKAEYVGTNKRHVKDRLARQIIFEIRDGRGGRFLRKIESHVEAEELGVPEHVAAWTFVEESEILQKVKQALRDKESSDTRTGHSDQISTASKEGESRTEEKFPAGGGRNNNLLQRRTDQVTHPQAPSGQQSHLAALGLGLPLNSAYRGQHQRLPPAQLPHAALARPNFFPQPQLAASTRPFPITAAHALGNDFLPGQDALSLAPWLRLNQKSGIRASISGMAKPGTAVAPPAAFRSPDPTERETGKSTGSRVLYAIFATGIQDTPGRSKTDQTYLSLIEWMILQVITLSGIPVWEINREDECFATGLIDGTKLTWGSLGLSLLKFAKEFSLAEENRLSDQRLSGAVSLAIFYVKQSHELARKTISLVEKIYQLFKNAEEESSELMPGASVSTWLGEHIVGWGTSLQIASPRNGRPVPYTSSDFIESHKEFASSEAFAPCCRITVDAANTVWQQIATLTRLRSIVTGNSIELLRRVLEISGVVINCEEWRGKPDWWNDNVDTQVVLEWDTFLIKRTLLLGCSGVGSTDITPFLGPIASDAVCQRISLLTKKLHDKQVEGEERLLLEERFRQHLASAQAVAIGDPMALQRASGLPGTSLQGQSALPSASKRPRLDGAPPTI